MGNYIQRAIEPAVAEALRVFRVVVITGPRQSGKTTLCRAMLPGYTYINLEEPALREQVAADPKAYIDAHTEGLIIDEAHTLPQLFSYIQVAVDAHPERRYVLTGSSNFQVLQRTAQSLAGRAALFRLMPMSLGETAGLRSGLSDDAILLRGGYPAVWCDDQPPKLMYANYHATYVERDVRQLLNIGDLAAFQHFMRLVAGRVGSEFNASALSNAVGVSAKTAKAWLSVLEASYIVFTLPPFFENIGKRLTKSPKVYFTDTGLLCYLLGIEEERQLAVHPLRGSVFENLVVAEAMKAAANAGSEPRLFFYRDRSQHEVDLLLARGWEYEAYEIKSSSTFTTSFLSGLAYLKGLLGGRLTRSAVVYAGLSGPSKPEEAVVNYQDFCPNNNG